uniref:G-protein coupled receptors family 1 profile domain-containing protein n=1 Tax=Meloidogyne javanica TaxID=6303 RepID=A0A915LX88_MELJA
MTLIEEKHQNHLTPQTSAYHQNENISPNNQQQIVCTEVSEAILAQGIDDLTSWAAVQCAIAAAYGCLFLLGLLGNGSVLLAFAQNKRLRSTRNLFLLNLILTDILLCLTAVPVTPWYALTKDWAFGPLMCRLVPLSNSCAVFVTSWSLCAIALDKFLHIIDPTRGQFSLRTAATITFVIWIISTLLNIPYLLSYKLVNGDYYVPRNSTPFCGQFCDELNWPDDTQRRLYGTGVMLFQFVLPMAIITYCYWRILRKVHKDMIVQNAQFSQSLSNTQRTDALNRKKRVNYILIGMVIAFIGCNTPITAVNLVKDFKQEPTWLKQQPFLWPLIAHVIAMSAVIWNPFLFFWLTAKDKQKGANLSGIATATSEIITSLVSRMHSLRSNNGQSKDEDIRYKRRFGRKTARHLYRAESETTTSTSHRRQILSNGLTFSDSLRLNGYGGNRQQWIQMRPLVIFQNGQQFYKENCGNEDINQTENISNSSSNGGRRTTLNKTTSLGVDAI